MFGLIASVFLLVMGLIPSFKLANRRAGMVLQASSIAQSSLEQAWATPFEDLGPDPETEIINIDGIQYEKTLTVVPSTTNPNLAKAVTVTLKWTWRDKPFVESREGIVCRVPRG